MTQSAGSLDAAWEALRRGKAPERGELLRNLTTGMDSMMDFLEGIYFRSYIPAGGSKIKFVTGNPGSGKTHFAGILQDRAESAGLMTAAFSAKEIWLHDFREVYLEILRQCDIQRVLQGCARQMIREMGYNPEEISPGENFLDMLAERGEGDALSKNEIRAILRRYFTRNPLLDNTFALCCSLLTGDILGYPVLENTSRELILAYLNGSKAVKLAQLRAIGLAPSAITRHNARHMLRSLCEIIRLSGKSGLLVVIDDLEVLLNRAAAEPVHYTRLRREDAYENIRQLIDDIDSMRYVLFCLCFDRELEDNESLGIKSYQALWLRIQNEVVSRRFNRFADMIDMDRYGDEMYTPEVLREMSRKLAEEASRAGISPVQAMTDSQVKELLERAEYGRLGLPYLVNRMTLEGGAEHE